MGAPAEIVARLALNAQSFSAENTRVFGDMERNAKDAAQRTRSVFETSFTEIQNLAKRALTLPRTDTGALNLDPGAARAAAVAAQQEAVALREIASAARQAADGVRDTSQETRLYVQAASAAANEAEQNAVALNQQAVALDRLQTELNQTSSATARLNQHQGSADKAARNNQLALRNLGFQVSDVGASLASGGNLFVIFGQQIGQVGGALSDMTGKAGALGRFLTNPWVAALTTAAIVVGVLYSRLSEADAAMDKAGDAADDFGRRQGELSNFIDKTTGRLAEQNKYLLRNAVLLRQTQIDKSNAAIETNRASAFSTAQSTRKSEFVAERQPNAIVYDNAVEAAILKSRGNQFALADELNDLSKQRPDLRPQIESINTLAARSIIAAREIRNARKEIDFLTGKTLVAPGFKPDAAPKLRDNSKAEAARAEFGRDAADRIADITSKFGTDPSRIKQAEKAIRDLDDIMDDLSRRRPPNFEQTIATAKEAKEVVENSLSQPFRDLVKQAQERQAVDDLVLRGQYAQADALQTVLGLERQMGPLSDRQLAKVLEITKAEEARARAIDDQRRQVGLYVQAVGDVQRSFEDLLTGGKIADFGKNLLQSFKSLQARILSESVFGGLERQMQDFVTGRAGVAQANGFLAGQATNAGTELKSFASVVAEVRGDLASGRISAPTSGISVPDSSLGSFLNSDDFLADLAADQADVAGAIVGAGQDIVVTAKRQIEAANDNSRAIITATDAFDFLGSSLGTSLKRLGIDLPKGITDKLGSILQGAAFGQIGAGVGGSVIGGKQSALGGAIGGVLGKELGGKLVSSGLSAISSKLGSLGGPLAGIAGGIIGSALGGLLTKTKKASSTLSIVNGEVVAGAATGNSSSYKANANALGGSVGDQLSKIAEALDGELSGSVGVSIGQRKKKFVVDTTGSGKTKGSGVLSFKTEEEAVIAAVRDALSDGVLTGISKAAQNILRSGQDLEKAITKAGLIESIPKALKQRLDPVGYALDEVNGKFKKIIAALKEGGGSAEQMADAQKLYNLELADAKSGAGGASQSLKDFLMSMKAGSSSPYSLGDQETSARAVLDPFLAQIKAGEMVDQDKYLSAAQTFLDIERQLYGSTSKYFDALNQIQSATGSAISSIDNAAPIRTVADPFIEVTATASKSTAASTSNMEQLLLQNNTGNAETNKLLQQMLARMGGAWMDQKLGY